MLLKHIYSKFDDIEYELKIESKLLTVEDVGSNNVFTFIKNIILRVYTVIISAKDAMKNKFSNFTNEFIATKKMHKVYQNLTKLDKDHKTVDFVDVEGYEKVMFEYLNNVRKIAKKYLVEGHGLSVHEAKSLLKKYKKVDTYYTNKINQIRNTKINQNPLVVLKWLKRNVNNKGSLIGVLEIYQKELASYKKQIDDVENRLYKYGEDNGYYIYPESFGEILLNTGRFITINMDWISAFVLSALVKYSSTVVVDKEISNIEKELDLKNPGVHNYNTARTIYNDDRYTSRGKTASQLLGLGSGALGVLGGQMHGMSHADKRNLI